MNLAQLQPANVGQVVTVTRGHPDHAAAVVVGVLAGYEHHIVNGNLTTAALTINGSTHRIDQSEIAITDIEVHQ